jgi:phage shock protein PspC (stress-responsive transcriptional regulator)
MTPLLLFIGGGGYLVQRFNWDTRVVLIFTALGLVFAGFGVWGYVRQIFASYEDLRQKPKERDKNDYDY